MIILDATNKSIVAVLGAVPTTQPTFSSHYADSNASTFAEKNTNGALNGTTEVILVDAPSSGVNRVINDIIIYNGNASQVILTISLKEGTTNYILWQGAISASSTFTLAKLGASPSNAYQIRSNENLLINGNFLVSQRYPALSSGQAFTSVALWGADRWKAVRAGFATGGVVARYASTSDFPYSLQMSRNAGDTSTAAMTMSQDLETVDSLPLQGKYLTLTVRARKDDNLSGTLSIQILGGKGTDQSVLNGLTSQTTLASLSNIALTSSYADYTVVTSSVIASDISQIAVAISFTPSGIQGASAGGVNVAGVKLEIGSYFTGWIFASLEQTLKRCERYYEKSYNLATAPGTATEDGQYIISSGPISAGVTVYAGIQFRTRKRTAPTFTAYSSQSGASAYVYCYDGGIRAVGVVVNRQTETMAQVSFATPNNSGALTTLAACQYTADAEL